MDAHWFQKLIDVLRVQTNSENEKLMVLYLDKELKKLKLPYTIDAVGNILVTKGKAKTYPCVVSHMDTVHNFVPNFEICQDKANKDTLFALNGKKRVGIGGDDKCGIFACLYLLKVVPQIKIVFFSKEEAGCKGSRDIDKRFFSDCRYLIQLDRRGKCDFIQTYWGKKTISHEFASEVGLIKKAYKYRNAVGTVTDVMKLWDNKVGISCINLSCGYYLPHTANEEVSVSALWNSVKFTEDIVNNMQPKRYPSLPPVSVMITTAAKTSYSQVRIQCKICKLRKLETMLYEDITSNSHEKICWSCMQEQKSSIAPLKGSRERHNTNENTDGSTDDITLFACFECGKTTDEMGRGDTLRYKEDGHLYCNGCADVLFASDNESVKCEMCAKTILKDHYRVTLQGMLLCGECAHELREYTGDGVGAKCWICNLVIPKDHKIIDRFGVRVCENCALPSDIIKDDTVN